jgi:hypothetical protein
VTLNDRGGGPVVVRPMPSSPLPLTDDSLGGLGSGELATRRGLFPLSHADQNTYVSVVKADIYQVQVRLDAINRGAPGRSVSTPRSSKRRSEIDAIKQSTLDVETIVKETTDPMALKLKLLEHLSGIMVRLEINVLSQTEVAGVRPFSPFSPDSSRPSTSGFNSAPASLSRLPSWLALVDRLGELGAKVEERSAGSGDSVKQNQLGAGSATNDCLEDLEEVIRKLLQELGLESLQATPSLLEQHGSALHATVGRLKRATSSLDLVRERGLRTLQQETEEARATARALGEKLEETRQSSQRNLKKETERCAKLQLALDEHRGSSSSSALTSSASKSSPSSSSPAPSTSSSSSSSVESTEVAQLTRSVKKLESEIQEYKDAAVITQKRTTRELESIQKKYDTVKDRLAEADRRRGDDAEEQYQEMQKLERKFAREQARMSQEVAELTKELGEAEVAARAKPKAMVSEVPVVSDTELHALQAQVQVQSLQMTDLTQQLVEETARRLSAAAGEGIDENLLAEVTTLRESNIKLRRQLQLGNESLLAARLSDEQDLELKQLRMNLRQAKEQLQAAEEEVRRMERREEQAVTEIGKRAEAMGKGDAAAEALRSVMMEQSRAMKSGHDGKLRKITEDHARRLAEHTQGARILSEALTKEREANSMLVKKLLSLE